MARIVVGCESVEPLNAIMLTGCQCTGILTRKEQMTIVEEGEEGEGVCPRYGKCWFGFLYFLRQNNPNLEPDLVQGRLFD